MSRLHQRRPRGVLAPHGALAALGGLAVTLSAAACFKPSFDRPHCGVDDACPSGTTCVESLCLRPDQIPDAAPSTPGVLVWARALSSFIPVGLFEAGDAVRVTGYFAEAIDLGGGAVTPRGTDTGVAVLAASDATFRSSSTFGGDGSEFAFLGGADSLGGAAPYLFGVSYGPVVDLGLGDVAGGGGPGADGFIGRYGGGAPTWVNRIVGAGEDKLVGSALQGGFLYALGWFEGTPTFERVELSSTGNSRDILFARLAPETGAIDVTRVLGSVARDEATAITPAGDELAATGFFTGRLAFSGSVAVTSERFSLDVWVAKLSLAGDARWAVSIGGLGEERGGPIVADSAGDLYVAGTFNDTLTLGSTTLTSRGGADVFLAKLRGVDGSVVWATSLGSAGEDNVATLVLDGAGSLALAATVAGELEPGGPAFGGLDACFASYDLQGTRRWLKVLGTTGDDRGWSVAAGAGAVYAGLATAGPLPPLEVPVRGPGADAYQGLLLKLAL